MVYNEYMEKEPEYEPLNITFNEDQELEGTPENVTLYTFLGRTALGSIQLENSDVDHVYVNVIPNEGRGFYIFNKFNAELFDIMRKHIEFWKYPQLINMRDVPPVDLEVYLRHKSYYDEKEAHEWAESIADSLPDFSKLGEDDPSQVTQEIALPDKLEIPDFLPDDFK